MHDAGKYELVVMFAIATLSFFGGPFYIIPLGAILLTLSTLQEYAHLQPRFARAGATRLMASGFLLAAAASLAFAALCFAIGRIFAWLVSA